jgi:predicted lactoylglutathione lyase
MVRSGSPGAICPSAARLGAGDSADPNPVQDHGVMFSRSIEDPDGYVGEVLWMIPAAQAGTPETA